jgi:hypothetical protein
LPPKLRCWSPKEKSPLPPLADKALEYETAKAWNYSLGQWEQESLVNKAKAMAHYLHMNMRSNYEMEQSRGKDSSKGHGKGLDSLMMQMGI